ncbi:MAG: DUF4861 domain-containing protein [Clostridium sp.]|nr:DUF4861 domain-containing protein [Clostridium sp.]
MTNSYLFRILAIFLSSSALGLCSCAGDSASRIIATNDSPIDRIEEIVEVVPAPAAFADESGSYALVNEEGRPVTYQITSDGALIFPASVSANSSATYYIKKSVDLDEKYIKSSEAPSSTLAYTVRPDCQDDFAWENEHSGYRLYGPSFKRGGGKVHGYDIWCKRNPAPIVDRFYNLDHGPEKISYHKDHGEGFDGYTVGPTLGAGANALVLDSAICYPTAYDSYEVVDNGPLRLTVKFTIDSIPFGLDENGQQKYIVESRMVSLDKLSHFNKVSSTYQAVESPTPIVAGIVVHADNPEGFSLLEGSGAISVVDLSDDLSADNGQIFVGLIMPGADSLQFVAFDQVKANAVGQALAFGNYVPGEPFTYYWGSAWSKGSVKDAEAWNEIITAQSERLRTPLKAVLK